MKIDSTLKASAVVIAIFAAIFIWYSNSFFMRKRKKEIALYSMMGIKKKQIGRMLFYENIAMGAIALIIGILVGNLFSKVFVMLLVNLMGFSTSIKFTIIPKAIIKTLITFAILFLITSIHGYTIIYRFKLIDLFKAENKGEKEPKASIIIALLSIILIGSGYILYLNSFKTDFLFAIFTTLALVVIGTYLFFSSFTVFMVQLARKNKRKYYKGINMIGTSQLLYRIKASSRTLATIAVLSATTLTAMGITSSIYYDFQTKLNIRYPFTYVIGNTNDTLNSKIEDTISKYPKNKIINSVDAAFININALLPNVSKINTKSKTIKNNIHMISESKFNEIAKARGLKEIVKLNNSNESILFYENFIKGFMKSYIDKNIEINDNGKKSSLKVIDFKPYALLNNYTLVDETLVVKDDVYNKYYNSKNVYRVKAYVTDNKKDSKNLTNSIRKIVGRKTFLKDKPWISTFSSYYESYSSGLMINGLLIFIGSFLGLVFLLSTGSIIFFKQLSEANDDKSRYTILKNIGVSKKEIKASISRQMLVVFVLPLLLGILHSLVATSILSKLLNLNLLIPITISVISYTIIYMIYYVLTVNSYYKLVS
ncbi:ABC transporter permease [Haloimpatiens sp. FM7330]|uniref:ABC transporter permease n=1 Tax=Haloimpatiens sp. FM7330 TaxID=3298610 RepID=UPI00362E9B69